MVDEGGAWFGPLSRSPEAGANLLVNSLVGIVLGLVFLGLIAFANVLHGSAVTKRTEETISGEIMPLFHAYYTDHGAFPAGSGGIPNILGFGGSQPYTVRVPCDPVQPCSTSRVDYYYQTGTTSDGRFDFLIETLQLHPPQTLVGLPRYVFFGTPPTTLCTAASCAGYIVYDYDLGMYEGM